jgi:hypothetical protein
MSVLYYGKIVTEVADNIAVVASVTAAVAANEDDDVAEEEGEL